VTSIESTLGTLRDRKQALTQDGSVRSQLTSISSTLKDLKEQQADYKETVQTAFKRIASNNPEQCHQLNIIYSRVQRIQALADTLPKLVARLNLLKEVHHNSVGIN
jgi:hypothetical protein